MKSIRNLWSPVSDEEYVARIRREIAFWDRWKWWVVGLGVAMIIATFAVFGIVIPTLLDMAMPLNIPFPWVVFLGGFALGANFGLLILKGVHMLAMAVKPFRAERMLLKILDTVPFEQLEEIDPGCVAKRGDSRL